MAQSTVLKDETRRKRFAILRKTPNVQAGKSGRHKWKSQILTESETDRPVRSPRAGLTWTRCAWSTRSSARARGRDRIADKSRFGQWRISWKTFTLEGRARGFRFESDEPEERGGTNLGPAPLSFFLIGAAF